MNNWLEFPLALLSFLCHKIAKFIIGNLYTVYLAFNRQRATQWQVLSAETLEKPLSLPVLMTKAPRWNTHAIIGTLGPIQVNQSVAVDLQSANFSSQSWIAIFYRFPSYETVASIESKDFPEGDWATVPLKPGKYTIGLRYYNWQKRVKLPTVKADSEAVTKAQEISADVNQFYNSLKEKSNWFHLCLHTYILTLLRYQEWLPEAFVKQEYLPVGATDTKFIFGYLEKSEKLQITVDSSILKQYKVYLTIYDRSSFPLTWCQINQEKLIAQVEHNSSYLLRIRQKAAASADSLQWRTSRDRHLKQVDIISQASL